MCSVIGHSNVLINHRVCNHYRLCMVSMQAPMEEADWHGDEECLWGITVIILLLTFVKLALSNHTDQSFFQIVFERMHVF